MAETKVKNKILIIMPRYPFDGQGACEQNRIGVIKQLRSLGYEISVVSKINPAQTADIRAVKEEYGIKLQLVKYKNQYRKQGLGEILKRLINPALWDGAAYEYFDPEIQDLTRKELSDFKPDIVLFEYTFLWPLYRLVDRSKSRIVVRSHNFEPLHFLSEDGLSPVNLVKFFAKVISELLSAWKADFCFAITPKEEKIYKRLGVSRVATLPNGMLPYILADEPKIHDRGTIRAVFMGSSYKVPHNKRALQFLLTEVMPKVREMSGKSVTLHITGAKLPKDLEQYISSDIVYEGYVDDLGEFLGTVDIAVIPSLMGHGMQMKVFEPMLRGIPLVSSSRAIAGYPFVSPGHYTDARDAKDYAKAISSLKDKDLRYRISSAALARAREAFSLDSYTKAFKLAFGESINE